MARETDIVTVHAVRENNEILFNERQQVFMPSSTAVASDSFSFLREAARKDIPVRATLEPKRGTVEKIETLKAEEIDEFRRTRTLLENPAKFVKVDVRTLDPLLFNAVDFRLKWPAFRLCDKVIPSFAKAQEIFDFCAAQTCSRGGPFDVTPCIPFQYVIDGCYARAHKMRKIITEKYKYCCEKVFSFADEGNDRLCVKADKWGGCCVDWWYHVAPLVRVKFKVGHFIKLNLAMVIDPGMFDGPVFLSTWLGAQENAICTPPNRVAHVSRYSIQAGSAYWPAGNGFATDPNYALTDGTLNNYKNLVTC